MSTEPDDESWIDDVLILTDSPDIRDPERDSAPEEPDEVIPLYIFDLDGTIALIDHRRPLVESATPDWAAFYRACVADSPNWPVVSTMLTLLDKGCDVWIWSGRSAEVMNETRQWLQRLVDTERFEEMQLCMRREGDFTPDQALKEGWLQAMSEFDRRRLVAVFDDRSKAVSMWRRNGVACFQVAPGEF